ncbi:sodium channel protein Nach-like [Contarinia nasturtii]|uniref:sodium channel protein Nach-like n=1 Tax=Contarinia nasturtii TaxID=265458 RepID=UPI0012D4214A|nr:sodium channel protein Nach-like [Contarinia nasturtii]
MQRVSRKIRRKVSKSSRKRRAILVRFIGTVDQCIQKIGKFLKFLNFDGIQHLTDPNRHIFERIFWLSIVFLFGFGVFYLCFNQWSRYKANPTVISLERDYRHWNGTMPAFTLCFNKKFNQTKIEEYIMSTWKIGPNDEDFEYYSQFIETISNLTLDRLFTVFEYEYDDRLHDLNLSEIVEQVYPKLDYTLKSFDSSIVLDSEQILSERGMCHVINSPISKVLMRNPLHSVDEMSEILTCFMYKNECFMSIEFYNVSATIEIHSPEEPPVYDSDVMQFKPADEITIIYKVTETLASDSLRSLNLQQRKCAFRSEIFDKVPILSGKLCEMNCRAKNALELCNCKPFFYPFVDGPECKLTGYLCLHQKSWPMWTLRDCKCPLNCAHYSYIEQSRLIREWSNEVLFTPKVSFRWEVVSSKVRNRRDVIFSFANFVGSFGGAAALFLGVNFWHFVVICLKILEKIAQFHWRRE